MIGDIYINGSIGSYEDAQGNLVRGVELVDVIQQYNSVKHNSIILVHVKSPGGLVETGNDIYNYLESLKKDHTVNTTSDGDIGSIATKIFLVGQDRVIGSGDQFFIHNPWTEAGAGDSNHLDAVSEYLKKEESNLRKFYLEKTGVTEEGLKPLMDAETSLTSEQAVNLGFATRQKQAIQALALIKNQNTMSKSNLEKIADTLLRKIKGEAQEKPEAKSLLVDLEGGVQVFVFTEDDVLEGKNVVVAEEGEPTEIPAPDGPHTLADGRTITVEAGIITAVAEAGEDVSEETLSEKILQLIEAQNQKIESIEASIKSKEDDDEPKALEFQAEIKALKELITVGKAPKAGSSGAFSGVANGVKVKAHVNERLEAVRKRMGIAQ